MPGSRVELSPSHKKNVGVWFFHAQSKLSILSQVHRTEDLATSLRSERDATVDSHRLTT